MRRSTGSRERGWPKCSCEVAGRVDELWSSLRELYGEDLPLTSDSKAIFRTTWGDPLEAVREAGLNAPVRELDKRMSFAQTQ